ncbi:MAG: 5'-methylthioadenosine/adenosylhomocysteine nucleosidase [Bacteroidales bacterium]|nr:5'-methylthioadenosine/adenosylhomocysteine nucleosidase [Bacteroidales bacterium]
MTIGIIVAMHKELELLLPLLNNLREETHQGFTFWEGTIGEKNVVAMECGIGKVNAALGTAALIDTYHPQLVINTGVAGGTGSKARMLDVVVGERVAYHDVWCGPGTQPGEAAGCPRFFEAPRELLSLKSLQPTEHLYQGLICSGDIFISQAEEVERIRANFPDVMAVDMESAAIAQTCYLRHTPYFCIRVVSDTPGGDDNISQYEGFWQEAPLHTFETLRSLISELSALD